MEKRKRGGQALPMPVKFERHVIRRDGCWGWSAAKDRKGYPLISRDGKNALAHRVAYEMFVGPLPADLNVCHRCDNPECTNPAHLFLGTQRDNMQDMRRKDRGTRGDRHPNVRLSEYDLADVRVLHSFGMSPYHISKHYHVGEGTIRNRLGVKGTRYAGARHHATKISDADLADIRVLLGFGMRLSELAREYGVSSGHKISKRLGLSK